MGRFVLLYIVGIIGGIRKNLPFSNFVGESSTLLLLLYRVRKKKGSGE